MARGTAAANQAGMKLKRSDKDAHIGANAAFKRPGYGDPRERLADMEVDGVEVEVLYSEVSAFRYIPDLKTGASEATRAFNDVLHEFASADRKRLCVSYQIPIHDIDFAVSEVHAYRCTWREVAPAAGLPGGVRAARLLRRAVRPPLFGHRGDRSARVLPHRPEHEPG